MIGACKWLARKCPNVLVLFAGLWIAAAPTCFAIYVEDHVINSNTIPEGLDAVLYHIHSLPYAETAAIVMFFLGLGTSATAIVFMIQPWIRPWLRPK